MSENPYAAPGSSNAATPDTATSKIQRLARIYKLMGWTITILYIPVVIGCTGTLIGGLLGIVDADIVMLLFASVMNTTILTVGILFIRTARRIRGGDPTVSGHAKFLSYVLMLGFPLFTIVGIICYRDISRYLMDAKRQDA